MCHLGKDSLLNKCHVRQMRKEEREREGGGDRERKEDRKRKRGRKILADAN